VGLVELRDRNVLFKSLFWATLVLTAVPAVAVPLSGIQFSYSKFTYLIGAVGVAHVGMTAFFFMGDRRYREIIDADRTRYVLVPAVLVTLAFIVFYFWPQGAAPYLMAHYAWLIWHFGRQNFGIYAFLAASNKTGAVSKLERIYFALLPVAVVPKALTLYPHIGLQGGYALAATIMTAALCIVCAGMGVVILRAVQHDRQRVIAILLGYGFFVPTMISSNAAVALSFYAHPVQYVIMMMYLAGDRKQGDVLKRIGLLLAIGFGFWAGLTFLSGKLSIAFLALTYGITQAHFVVDAGLWKLKLPKQRAAILSSFDFLFSGDRKVQSVEQSEPARATP
jgi:hypothetical protein